ncbi:hypothetical protein BJ085DRAFT_37471 [Dimargaris cristalligena]|uniref:Uncharacterized protein n=1 Tax=Dimargaris cristalligena TaxID=215637 RepID=A0A4Q0A2X5_9FUNG|nr:hypothetical protein BJ085DRAFT_37471 [Dimargaris cristalligena]|eukprot:RKP40427.1 hypothetical protein BJ085DRAFT_37471 [Dimargaris cristalligena]
MTTIVILTAILAGTTQASPKLFDPAIDELIKMKADTDREYGSSLPETESFFDSDSGVSGVGEDEDEYAFNSPSVYSHLDHSEESDSMPSFDEIFNHGESAPLDNEYHFKSGSYWEKQKGLDSLKLTDNAKAEVNGLIAQYFTELPGRFQ